MSPISKFLVKNEFIHSDKNNSRYIRRGSKKFKNKKGSVWRMVSVMCRCYKCGCGIESGRDFLAIDAPGTQNRRWVCTKCADLVQKQTARNMLGKTGMEITRMISPGFLK